MCIRDSVKNEQKAEIFLNVVSETLDNGGTVVIPSLDVYKRQTLYDEIVLNPDVSKIKE